MPKTLESDQNLPKIVLDDSTSAKLMGSYLIKNED